MKPFQIFKPGKHTASNGAVIDFSDEVLKAAVSAYSPDTHEAPIVVGHPRDNGPAYGWIKSLSFADGAIVAEPQQLDADFAEMVQAGRFKKRSASWYLPDAPNNPKPGTLYLRHVGFLGAQPPAVKGLKEVAFAEAEEGVVEFSETERWAFSTLADVLRRLREWLIEEKGAETADKVLPQWDIDGVTRAANEPEDGKDNPAAMPSFTEKEAMTIEELKAQVAALTAERDALAAKQSADFSEQENALKAREAALAAAEQRTARAGVESRVDAAVKAGRVLPAQRSGVVAFAMSLADAGVTVDFGEGDKVEKLTQRDAYLRQIESAPAIVNYGELSAPNGGVPAADSNPVAVAEKARDLVKTKAAEGKTISFTEAVAEVTATQNT